jgi:lipopolysaccharide/colanic/teichoic acid biosynthesis glycosyltransferase
VHGTVMTIKKRYLSVLDIATALVIYFAAQFLFPLHEGNILFVVSTCSFLLSWVIFYKKNQLKQLLSSGYEQVFYICATTLVISFIFFAITRSFYSLKYLALSNFSWCLCALSFRYWLLRNNVFHLAVPNIDDPSKLVQSKKIRYSVVNNPTKINLLDYNGILFDSNKLYPRDWLNLFTHARIVGVPIFTYDELVEFIQHKISIDYLNGTWLDNSFELNYFYNYAKRFFDLALIVLFLPILLPLTLIIASAIFVTMNGKVIYQQKRIGKDNQEFWLYKFKTMRDTIESANNNSLAHDSDRITSLGKILRRFRLDELAQFYNVLIGNMSIIGPRPLVPEEQDDFIKKFAKDAPIYQMRHWVYPGITGWAQVHQGHTTEVNETKEKLCYDIYYVKHFSFGLDVKILIMTIGILFSGFGAR